VTYSGTVLMTKSKGWGLTTSTDNSHALNTQIA